MTTPDPWAEPPWTSKEIATTLGETVLAVALQLGFVGSTWTIPVAVFPAEDEVLTDDAEAVDPLAPASSNCSAAYVPPLARTAARDAAATTAGHCRRARGGEDAIGGATAAGVAHSGNTGAGCG